MANFRKIRQLICWSNSISFIDGWIPKFSFFIPIVGYLLVFNDSIVDFINISKMVDEQNIFPQLKGIQRLRWVYFGLFFLGMSNFIFAMIKPKFLKLGKTKLEYTKNCLEMFSYYHFFELNSQISQKGDFTIDGKYYDSDWEGFSDLALDTDAGTDVALSDGDWEGAKNKYGNLLRQILSQTFSKEDQKYKGRLYLCICLSAVGYICLLIPSTDLFLAVIEVSLL